jgi:pSer/pThr/pTyr-binding forkhead associated (FHA) protein
MDILWSTLLFAAKWLFIGLIYFALFVVLLAVRREMRQQVRERSQTPSTAAAGRLKVIKAGSDPHLQPGAILALDNETLIGAAQGNHLTLADSFVSGRHAQLRWDGAEWWLEDLGSRNGTFVNGRPSPPHRQQPLPFGATLTIGDVVFELVE